MAKKGLLVLVLAGLVAGGVFARGAADSRSPQSGNTITVRDDANRDVTVNLPVERVALLDSGLGTAMSALGVLDRIVGTHQALQTKLYGAAANAPMIATYAEINYEALAGSRPQLVLSATSHHGYVSDSDHLDEFGIKYIALDLRTPSKMRNDITILARLFQREEAGQRIIAFYDKYQRIIDQRLAAVPESSRPWVYLEMHAGPLHTGSSASQFYQQVELAGGRNIARDLEDNALADDTEVSAEWVAQKNPDFIVREVSGLGYTANDIAPIKAIYDEIRARPGFGTINAVRNGKLFLIGNDIHSRPGYIVGVCYLAKSFYPELFADFDIEAINKEWFAIAYPGYPLEGIWTYSESSE
ncbi:MAG: ABC transporter substrate-binding protein [Treponema sp.]|jgi:iron complex transport system substrate-binding protein|nr:ABC transporter substrate-binding protein [Treponema sp.]